jgi:hypothetical protein
MLFLVVILWMRLRWLSREQRFCSRAVRGSSRLSVYRKEISYWGYRVLYCSSYLRSESERSISMSSRFNYASALSSSMVSLCTDFYFLKASMKDLT